LEERRETGPASSQELSARNINPMKLIMLLRVRFGIGNYEVSVTLPPGDSNRVYKLKNSIFRGHTTYIPSGPQEAFLKRR
jgi:hypothetical protein